MLNDICQAITETEKISDYDFIHLDDWQKCRVGGTAKFMTRELTPAELQLICSKLEHQQMEGTP